MRKKPVPLINREISWLSFNERVLQEASDKSTPLLERLKFLGIFSNNRDEFYRVRVATIKRLTKLGRKAIALYGEDPKDLLIKLQRKVIEQQNLFEEIYQELKKELSENNVFILNEKQLSSTQRMYVSEYFSSELVPNLFPIMIDESKPFPYMKDEASYLYLKLQSPHKTQKHKYALIEIPSGSVSRFVILPKHGNKNYIMLVDDVIRYNTDQIFEVFGYKTVEAYNVKLTRDAELEIDNDLSKSMIEKISKSVKARKQGQPVRFVYDAAMPDDMLRYIMKKLSMSKRDNAIPGGRYHNFKDFIRFPDLNNKDLVYNHPLPLPHPDLAQRSSTILKAIKAKDIMLHYPYHTFNHIIDLLREASIDPSVESIKITLYRLANGSKIATSLINAVKNGKKVTALVELQARFDEENNIYWANKLQEEGARVIFGVPGLKVHSKLCLITTLENGKEMHYGHIGTGNFNEKTSRIYTDFSLLTANRDITADLGRIFDFYENNFRMQNFKHLVVAPFFMRDQFVHLVNREIKHAREGKNAEIILKMNSLVDREMIKKLYEASKAGVKIRLIIRGACCLVTGIEGLSDNIEAYSIVDKYLEHARVFVFHNAGDEKIYISSADWMSRNLDNRSEVAVPIYSKEIRRQLKDIISIQLSGNTKVRILDSKQENEYKKPKPGEKRVRVQDEVYLYLKKEAEGKVRNNKNKQLITN
ncbi:MAG TPA: polyphosphate kinase 1 [Bacteroidia bacterium]|nr:polyphosphate kinase 1 [Bacteroidia bacterium]